MAKLTHADIKAKAEEYAKTIGQIGKVKKAYVKEVSGIMDQQAVEMADLVADHAEELKPFEDRYQPKIDKLNEKAAGLYSEILGWLQQQKKSITLETENTVLRLLKGSRPGNRKVDPAKFVEICIKRGIEGFWRAVNVVLKDAEPILGKNDLEAICSKPEVPFEEASLELK